MRRKKNYQKNDFLDDRNYDDRPRYDDYDNINEEENLYSNEPISDETIFKQRNDPAPILEQLRLELLNKEKIKVPYIDQKTGERYDKEIIVQKKNTTPRMNEQGINAFITYLRFLINNHTVTGNLVTREDYNIRMRYISDDIVSHLTIRREDWGITINDLDPIIASSQNFVDLFLTRTLFNEERKGYQGFTENRTINTRPPERRPGLIDRLGRGFGFR